MTGSATALLVMDLQQGVVAGLGPEGRLVVEAARRAVEAARAAGLTVIFVRVAFRPGYPEAAASNASFGRIADRGVSFEEQQPATQLDAALAPRADEPIVVKRRVSAFSGSDLDVLLRAAGAGSLVLAGIGTGGVVLSTLRQAADLDYRITVLADACADRDPEVHRVLLEKLFPRQATVTTVDAWAETLG